MGPSGRVGAVAFADPELEGARQKDQTLADDAGTARRKVAQPHVERRISVVEDAARLAKATGAKGTALIGKRIGHTSYVEPYAGAWLATRQC